MKMLAVRCLVALTLLAAAAVAFANPFKSKIISGTDSTARNHGAWRSFPEDHEFYAGQEAQIVAVVEVTLPGDTENGGTTNVLTATRIDLAPAATRRIFPKLVIE